SLIWVTASDVMVIMVFLPPLPDDASGASCIGIASILQAYSERQICQDPAAFMPDPVRDIAGLTGPTILIEKGLRKDDESSLSSGPIACMRSEERRVGIER